MDEIKTDTRSMVMEGMYRGVTGKIDEVLASVSKELQFTSAQQVSAYEALTGALKEALGTLLAEFRYLSQQSSAIYDYGKKEREAARDAVMDAIKEQSETGIKPVLEELARLRETLEARQKAAEEEQARQFAALREELLARIGGEAPAAETGAQTLSETAAEENFDYDVLAEKIASVLPEPDFDLIADKVAAAVPPLDTESIAVSLAAAVPAVDENAIADKVAENIPLIDYDLIAERVSGILEGEFDVTVDEAGVEKIASAVSGQLDYEKIAARVAELLSERGAAPAPLPAREEVAAAAAPAPRPAPPAPKPAAVKPAAKPVLAPADDPELTTRYKRSFRAKIIESDAEVKGYYFDLKNAFLSYARIASQVSWSNDRFTFAGDTVAKIGVRGKTLCVYLALNPDEFPSSVYHQRFAGDTKMYEKTPMMVKVKSGVALKRAIRLIEMLMENLGAVKEDRDPVDYSEEFAFRSEEQLLAEGLIKTAVVEKSDLDF